jgi:hypothetical protein
MESQRFASTDSYGMMPEEEKLAAQEHLKRFQHLIKDDPEDG